MSYTGLVERGRKYAPHATKPRVAAIMEELCDAIEALTRPVDVEAVTTAIWNAGFHPDDVASGEAERRKADWPEEWLRCQKRAAAALAKLGKRYAGHQYSASAAQQRADKA